jgi:hypothetical protein
MKLDFRGIPARILQGKVPEYITVYRLYRAKLTHEIMRRVNDAFFTKSDAGTDDLGNKWKPLAPTTIKYKPPTPIEKGTYRLRGSLSTGLLNPSQRAEFYRIYSEELTKLSKIEFFDRLAMGIEDPKKEATKRAWRAIKSQDPPETTTNINIRTGALVASTAPGQVYNHRYYAPKFQQVTIATGINIKLTLPYASAVDAVRPVIPDNVVAWILEAHEQVIPEVKALYDDIKSRVERRKNKAKNRKSPRN